ncbi:glycerol dehydrogenase [Neosynechococcus sphagnicola sy1]|uniref:Glycerol dehydrogenase n=1 Tax=Neosynechococcus sphagnicola sy1 TaxID=1497020 RepID=A0A098TSH0_9CYAN|nr:DUF3119 family protein [Neosynechococcus sphagnicola]KGF73723.1 glycerol dehydrogenase [Neosynechococcus sphagnicola sy1]
MTLATPVQSADTVQLAPSYVLPLTLVAMALPLVWVQIWLSLTLSLFGLFLLFQAVTLRLLLTSMALEIYRGQTLIRRFPYGEWLNWQIFWSPLPILFYFREVNSIHFLPILFDPKALQTCLEQFCPRSPG